MSSPGHGQLLKRKIALAAPLLQPATGALWDHPRLSEMFPEFLVAIHGSVRATLPLMEAAVRVAARDRHTDAVCGALCEYLPEHIEEEREHEEWLLQDLEVLGLRRQDVLGRIPMPAVAAMVGAQYYWIFHVHPVALLGFFAVLEGHPPTLGHLAEIERRTGLPSDAFRMLRHHAELDVVHADELFSRLDALPLSRQLVELVGTSALHTMAMLTSFFGDLTTRLASRAVTPGCADA
jgi:hypothetical protein